MFRLFITSAICVLLVSSCIFSGGENGGSNSDNDTRGYKVKVGDMAPDFEIEYLDGTKIKLSDLRGKVVMIQFAASWCKVCREEMPHIESEIWQKYKENKDFALVAVDLKESKEEVIQFINNSKFSYPITLDTNGDKFALYTESGAGVTRNIIINREGKIIMLTRLFDLNEFDKMVKLIEEELK